VKFQAGNSKISNMNPVARGSCYAIFVYDIAFSINLGDAERHISTATRETIKHRRRTPRYFDYHPAPLRIQSTQASQINEILKADRQADLVVYDFGAVSVIYRINLDPDSDLLALSQDLYENKDLLDDSLRRVQELLRVIGGAVSKANISSFVEDYVIFHVEKFTTPVSIADLSTIHAQDIAQILRAESRELSKDEISDAVSNRISYGNDDIVIADWNAALVVDKEPEDVLTVLEFANVELLEMRFLDHRLDDALGIAYDRLSRRSRKLFQFRSHSADLREISQWQVDSAILFEGVNNVLKLLGDQYLARLYRLTAQRFHLTDWDASILRKLETLEGIYQKLSDQFSNQRMEILEWIIIALIVLEIILPFLSQKFH